jgi:hypothetical protein
MSAKELLDYIISNIDSLTDIISNSKEENREREEKIKEQLQESREQLQILGKQLEEKLEAEQQQKEKTKKE